MSATTDTNQRTLWDRKVSHSDTPSSSLLLLQLDQLIDIRGHIGFQNAQSINDCVQVKLDTLHSIYRDSETNLSLCDVLTGLEKLGKLKATVCGQEPRAVKKTVNGQEVMVCKKVYISATLLGIIEKAIQVHLDMVNRKGLFGNKADFIHDLHSLARIQSQAQSEEIGKLIQSKIEEYYDISKLENKVSQTEHLLILPGV